MSVEIIPPQDIAKLIAAFASGKDGNFVIKSGETMTLKSDYQYEFTHVRIEKDATLRVIPWDSSIKSGGRLLIQSMSTFVIRAGGKIDLTACGYKGGRSCLSENLIMHHLWHKVSLLAKNNYH